MSGYVLFYMSIVSYMASTVFVQVCVNAFLCCVFYESGVCFVLFAMCVQAEHVAEDPGWQVGNKNYINRKKQKLCAALFSSESVLKI